jgi:hypothetical protein
MNNTACKYEASTKDHHQDWALGPLAEMGIESIDP